MNAAGYVLLGAALGYAAQYLLARQREHVERRLAQDARVDASRRAVYPDLLRAPNRLVVGAHRKHPLIGPPPPPPAPLSARANRQGRRL
jgi:hypothetical protein